ncbi:MAG TPA: complex I NDUFA9 subunit family protein [Allosphingosinicella sp.]|nr:complex I NDUFA9 subunit family protein [Allosphingosinicella sp.]
MDSRDRVVTLFGGGGFLGRYAAQALFRTGARVRVAERDPRRAYFLKPLAAIGQVQFVAVDIRDPTAVREAVRGSDAVVNLIGILKGDFDGIHVAGARNVAEAAAAAGASALVHVSAIGADPGSESAYGRSKGEGEEAVRAAFPRATILRPSILFGREDNFINRFAAMARLAPVLPVISGGTKFQPVYVADVGRAVAAAALDPVGHAGRTYELGGPQVLTMRELMEWVCEATGRGRPLIDIPDPVGRLIARATGWLPAAPITWDQWLMLRRDNVVSEGMPGLEAFGLPKTPLAAVSEGWLASYRRHGRFAAKSPY